MKPRNLVSFLVELISSQMSPPLVKNFINPGQHSPITPLLQQQLLLDVVEVPA